eukprot:TRINITY_DN34071_c0_g1_i1.p1 TRINITY_DN34071_c0_g1~~TRINITY_DN34071_c0_g1_i1.p1  ORF type:complete len:180 (+),score=29.16 TRINITY_DN34071_c0_g1_i1:41-541(+)
MILKVTGSQELLASVKTDSKDGKFIWSVEPNVAFEKQITKLDNLKRSFNIHASGAGLEGIMELSKYPERTPIKTHLSPSQNGLKTYDTIYVTKLKPKNKPPQQKPKSTKTEKPPKPAPSAPQPTQVRTQQTSNQVAIVCPAPYSPLDWDEFITYWENKATQEMNSL